MTITITADLITAIDARYEALGGDYWGTESIEARARYYLPAFAGSVADFIELVADELRFDD
jgi:hypothetical protein